MFHRIKPGMMSDLNAELRAVGLGWFVFVGLVVYQGLVLQHRRGGRVESYWSIRDVALGDGVYRTDLGSSSDKKYHLKSFTK